MMQFIPRNSLQGRTGYEEVTGKTPDISEYCDFDFYDLVWYHSGVHPSISDDNREMGRRLGVSHRIGSDMCYWVITESGKVIAETTVQHVTRDDLLDPEIVSQVEKFTTNLDKRLDDENFWIERMSDFNFDEDDYDLPQWDPAYGDNTPNVDKNGSEMETTPLADADNLS